MSRETLKPGHFDGLYDQSPDPYGFTSRWYETRKYALSLAMLPWPRYRRAFEPGCSIGVLTAQLAAALRQPAELRRVGGRGRCGPGADGAVPAGHGGAAAGARRLADRCGQFDLIVLSELLYYLSDEDLARTVGLAVDALAEGGTLLAVHWRRPVPFHPQTGDGAHAALARRPELTLLADHREPDFLAQVYLRAPAGADPAELSVAAAEGLT